MTVAEQNEPQAAAALEGELQGPPYTIANVLR